MVKINKIVWILALVLLVCTMSVNAELSIQPFAFYNMDESSGTYMANLLNYNKWNGTLTGSTISLLTAGVTNYSYTFSGASPKITINEKPLFVNNKRFSISVWLGNWTPYRDGEGIFSDTTDNTLDYFVGSYSAGTNIISALGNGDCSATWTNGTGTNYINYTGWHNLVVTYNGTFQKLYYDGIQRANASCTNLLPDELYQLGLDRSVAGRYYHGDMDEVGLWNDSLTENDIKAIYSNGTAGFSYNWTTFAGAGVGNLTFVSQTPANNTQFNYTAIPYSINFTNQLANSTNTNVTCNLTVNSVMAYGGITTANQSGYINTAYTTPTGTIDYNWTCINQDNPQVNFTSATYRFYVDTTFPNIASDFLNQSIWYNQLVTGTFNFTDDQALFAYNISIDQSVIKSVYLNGTTNTSQYSLSSAVSYGKHNLSILLADGHTAIELKDTYSISKGLFGDILQFSTAKDTIKIQEKNKNLNDRWTETKLKDRYTFKYLPTEKPRDSYTFIVDCSSEFYIIDRQDLPYKKWLVCSNKWIDFKVKENNDFTIDIKKNTNKQAEVIIGNLKGATEIEFESIGELNIRTAQYSFSMMNASATWNTAETESHTQSQYLYLNRTADETTNAVFYFNTTNVTSILKTNISNMDIYNATFITPNLPTSIVPIQWNFTFYGLVNNVSGVLNNTQSVTNLIISNCSLPNEANTTSRTYFIYDSSGLNKLNANMTAVFQLWHGNRTTTLHNQSISWFNQNNATICIRSDNNEGISYDLSMIVASAGYSTSTIVENNGTLTTTPTTQNVYLIAGASNFILKVINQISDPLPNYAVAQYEYDVTTDTEHFVSSLSTDINGQVLFYYTSTKQYRFIIEDSDGVQRLDTGRMYITANPTTIKIDLGGTDIMSPTIAAWNLRTTLYNVSKTIYLNWTTLSGTPGTICMNVSHVNATKTRYLSGQCSASSYGSLDYTYAEGDGIINAVAFVKTPTYVTNILSITISSVQKLYQFMGVSSMLIYIIFVMVAIGVSITRVTTMPVALLFAHVISWWMGIIPGYWGFIMTFAAALLIIMDRVKD